MSKKTNLLCDTYTISCSLAETLEDYFGSPFAEDVVEEFDYIWGDLIKDLQELLLKYFNDTKEKK